MSKPFDPYQPVVDYAGQTNYVAGGASGLDLPPRLDKLQCRNCGNTVEGLKCPVCEMRADLAEHAKEVIERSRLEHAVRCQT